ncbi:18007_t:CDS:2 [Rhizophagus irregularis]|nr:18007_t:CDS:2 [Rhizophagus irregularis]
MAESSQSKKLTRSEQISGSLINEKQCIVLLALTMGGVRVPYQ